MSVPQPKFSTVKKFYFLEYFYVLLKSIEKYASIAQVFESFKVLKQEHRLGESKYKIRFGRDEDLSPGQLDRYKYTFKQVIEEAKDYGLITDDDADSLSMTDKGREVLSLYSPSDPTEFNRFLFRCMESSSNGTFRYIVEFLYKANAHKPGLVIFPSYSPRQLAFERSAVQTTQDIVKYSEALAQRLQEDIKKHLGKRTDLGQHNTQLITRLYQSELLSPDPATRFDPTKYNVITKRFRDHWLSHFLRELYGFEYSFTTFDRWVYRGKQIGILYATEFYPNFTGRIVYPTSVVLPSARSADFDHIQDYPDGQSLYVHNPRWEYNQDEFVKALVDAYFQLRAPSSNYFINLPSMRELVCYNMKIPEYLFEDFLGRAYRLNLSGDLRIKISLEVDKLPEETTAMYLKREPVVIGGQYKNIIAIDVAKGV